MKCTTQFVALVASVLLLVLCCMSCRQRDMVARRGGPLSEYEHFRYLREITDSQVDYDSATQSELNSSSHVKARQMYTLVRLMANRAILLASPELARALEAEKSAWEAYHNQFDSTYRKVAGPSEDHWASSWDMCVGDALMADVNLRKASLEDFYYLLADGILHYRPEKHRTISPLLVEQEYTAFVNSMEDNEYLLPLAERKQALSDEMPYWTAWMKSREEVSASLAGKYKKVYDNATNNLRRMKFIMLRNRYEGYGVVSNDIISCLVPYTIRDKDLLSAPSFDESWAKLN